METLELDREVSEVVDLVPGLGAREIDRELRLADRQTDAGTRRLAFYLADMEVRGICQILGFPTATAYAVCRLEMGKRHAQQLIAAGRALEELPEIDAAFCDGRLNWTRVRLLTKIAVPETENAWLERALELRLGDLEREVLTSEKGRPPRKGGHGLPQIKIGVAAKLDRLPYEKWELAKRKLSDETGDAITDADLMGFAADLLLSTRRDGAVPGRERVNDSNYRIVIDLCSNCDAASLATLEGKAEIPKATFEMIACDAKVERMEDVAEGGKRGEAQAGHAGGHPHLAGELPGWMRTKVLVRDHFMCLLCGNPREVQAHHVIWRSHNGPHRLSNLGCLCSNCHALVHDELIVITGEAPHRLEVSDRDGRPLARTAEAIGPVLRRLRQSPGARILPGLAAPTESGAPAIQPLPEVTFVSLPKSETAAWYQRHVHLFTSNAERGEMVFQAGCGIEPEKRPADVRPALGDDGEPLALAKMIGQTRVVEGLTDAVAAARARRTAVDHILLLGEAGLGKTTLARAVANEIGSEAVVLNGPSVKDATVLAKVLTGLAPGSVLFIDEIHGLSRPAAEGLYDAMEAGVLRLAVTDGRLAKSLEIRLNPFTLIGATTELGKVPKPLLSRFTIKEHLDLYEPGDLAGMVARGAARDGLEIEQGAALRIGGLAHGVARDAIKLSRRVQGLALARGRSAIDTAFVADALRRFGIDERGLGPIEQKALRALEGAGRGRAMGLARWSAASALAVSVLRGLEPLLVRLGLVAITTRGRMAVASEGHRSAA